MDTLPEIDNRAVEAARSAAAILDAVSRRDGDDAAMAHAIGMLNGIAGWIAEAHGAPSAIFPLARAAAAVMQQKDRT